MEDWDFSTAWGVGSIKEADEGSSGSGPKRGVFCKALCCKPLPPDNTGDNPKPIEDSLKLQSVTYRDNDYLFISDIQDRHTCAICLSLACSAVQSSCCGCTFCSGCIREWKSQHMRPTCPQCRRAVTEVPDRRNEMEILNLELVCPNYQFGCEWRGALGKVDNHLEKACEYVKVDCANRCGQKPLKKNAANHGVNWCPLRIVRCPFCLQVNTAQGFLFQPLTYRALITTHSNVCLRWPTLCPNGCNKMYNLDSSSLKAHLEQDCPNKIVSCEFANCGCSKEMKQSEMSEHIHSGTIEHLLLMNERFQDEIDYLREENAQLWEAVNELRGSQKPGDIKYKKRDWC